MAETDTQWPDLVEKALFEKDPARRTQRIKDARKAIEDRLRDLDVEKQMLQEATQKLEACR